MQLHAIEKRIKYNKLVTIELVIHYSNSKAAFRHYVNKLLPLIIRKMMAICGENGELENQLIIKFRKAIGM